jgi:hypothetical protein
MTKLTTADVAKKLDITPSRVVQLVNEGKLVTITKRKRGQQRSSKYEFDSVDVELYMGKKNGEVKKLTPLPPMPRKEKPISVELKEAINMLVKILSRL